MVPFSPVARRSLGDQVFDQLSAQILRGELAPGEGLPPERSLVELLGVNRQAVREALKRLEQAGLVDVLHGGGTTVTDWRRRAGLDLLPRLLVAVDGTIDPGVVRSIMEFRGLVGPDVAARCAERAVAATTASLTEVARSYDAVTAVTPLDELAALDTLLWQTLVDGADNIAYRLAYNALRSKYVAVESVMRSVLAEELTALDLRRRMVAAVLAGDGVAARALATDLLAIGTAAVAAAVSSSPHPRTEHPEAIR
jgi:GntR family transcriptional regulator, transcriptional repressor for pyruvate dehydrogenase complex